MPALAPAFGVASANAATAQFVAAAVAKNDVKRNRMVRIFKEKYGHGFD